MTDQEITDRLSTLSKDLLFPSESEYPLETFTWEASHKYNCQEKAGRDRMTFYGKVAKIVALEEIGLVAIALHPPYNLGVKCGW